MRSAPRPRPWQEALEPGLVLVGECTEGGRPETHEEQQAAFEAEHKRQAALQMEWEALARRDYESRRDSVADP